MENAKLIWDQEKKGWFCSNCGAVYIQTQNWIPKASYCMKCKTEWRLNNE